MSSRNNNNSDVAAPILPASSTRAANDQLEQMEGLYLHVEELAKTKRTLEMQLLAVNAEYEGKRMEKAKVTSRIWTVMKDIQTLKNQSQQQQQELESWQDRITSAQAQCFELSTAGKVAKDVAIIEADIVKVEEKMNDLKNDLSKRLERGNAIIVTFQANADKSPDAKKLKTMQRMIVNCHQYLTMHKALIEMQEIVNIHLTEFASICTALKTKQDAKQARIDAGEIEALDVEESEDIDDPLENIWKARIAKLQEFVKFLDTLREWMVWGTACAAQKICQPCAKRAQEDPEKVDVEKGDDDEGEVDTTPTLVDASQESRTFDKSQNQP